MVFSSKRVVGLLLSVGVLFSLPNQGLAQQRSPLRMLGEAMNQEYRDIKALGPNPTPSQITAVRRKVYSPVIAEGYAQGIQTYVKERHKVDDGLKELRTAMFPGLKKDQAKTGAKGGDNQADQAGGGINGQMPPGTGAPAERAKSGELGGADGAKDVQFGGKRDNKKKDVKMIDGIIQ